MEVVKNLCTQDKKIIDYLDELKIQKSQEHKILIIVDHGLGDHLRACEIIDEISEDFPDINIKIGSNFNRGFKILHEKSLPLRNFNNKYNPDNFNFIALGQYDYYDESFFEKEGFDYVFFLIMPFQGDPNFQRIANTLYFNGKLEIPKSYWKKRISRLMIGREYTGKTKAFTKQELCAILEFGIKPPITKKWKCPEKMISTAIIPKLVGMHWMSNSSKDARGLTNEQAEHIWKTLEELGYIPFDLSMDFSAIRKEQTTLFPIPEWIPKDRTFRFYKDDLELLIKKISECQYFIGTDSGPMHLATSLIGPDRCMIIEKISSISNVAPDIKNIYKLEAKGGNLKKIKPNLEKFLSDKFNESN